MPSPQDEWFSQQFRIVRLYGHWALGPSQGGEAPLFELVPMDAPLQDLPKNTPQKYTITLYDMKTWEPVDIEADGGC